MPKYAKFIDAQTVTYPNYSQPPFNGISNPDKDDSLLRANGYYPLTGEPEPQEGKVAVLDGYQLHEATKMVTRAVQVEVPDYDPETHEQTGSHMEWQEQQVEEDDSYIEVTAYHYEDIPAPEPPDTSERDAAELAIVGAIKALAVKYNATADIEAMTDITIPALKELAASYSVTDADMMACLSEIQLQVLQLEAVEGTVWAACWQGIKGRFAQWWSQINE